MIALALSLLAMQAAPPPVGAQDDIVVTARRLARLKRLRMTTRIDRRTGATRCVFKRRSGDDALDAEVCAAVLACVPKVATIEEMQGCIAPTMNRLTGDGVAWQADAAKGSR
ncbi:hypothetical protein [Sphingomonas baiyangensis]|uniref:UrcA family protein n=1 Tax=Sphingomonas baiyangensis TaxID=2572576 RepID=A0A4U1L4K1_9SPHN|nr:hypothetical protein [Sphingomonas baiyangensis]TKD51115.1 hypothetical protein FBR43_10355 [Sphingomonas baiyangensis]